MEILTYPVLGKQEEHMRKSIVAGLMASLVMAGVGSAPAQAQYGPRDAKQMCKQAVRDRGAYDTSGVNVDSLGGSKYNVTGTPAASTSIRWVAASTT
jgi:hypothetical protein